MTGGLALAQRYFEQHGLPMLRTAFAEDLGRIAAGLVGDGSDCLGFDDEYSRDHDWGPGFCLWLSEIDYGRIGEALATACAGLPSRFEGFQRSQSEWGGGRLGVFEIGSFYRSFTGRRGAPTTPLEWLRIPEKNLAACTNGRVFHDPLDEFSTIRRQLLDFYPDDVRLAKIAARCMTAGQSGQYNFRRSVQRGEPFAAQYAETKFAADIMSLIYLINRRYAPYYKWLQRGLIGLPRLGRFAAAQITALTMARHPDEKTAVIDAICRAVIDDLQAEGLCEGSSPFLVDHGPTIHEHIVDPNLRRLDVWAG